MPVKHSDIMSSASERIQRTEAYAEKVRKMFAATVNDILALNKSLPKLDEGVMYSFDDENMKKQKEVERLLRRLHSSVVMAIKQGITLEWEQANQECDKLVSSAFGKAVLSSAMFKAWTERNKSAMQAFINRSEKGLNLSDRIWKSVHQLRDEMEVAMTIGIGEGESAASMSRKVRQYLNDPDLMFRRFRYKNEKGEWKLKWKKRIKDEDTGKYKWIDYDKKSYQDQWTGKGYYKSSAQNAMRVTRTETNIAYRRADHERWSQMEFVLGQRVQLSHNHPVKDICDKLQGDYPKEFVFDGWHPQCFCYVTPILVDESEMKKSADAFLKGKKYTPQGKQITEYPEAFKDWVKEHAEDIKNAREAGKEPYFIKNNAKVIDNILNPKKQLTTLEKAEIRHNARTAEQRQAIIDRWEARKKNPLTIAANRHAARTPEQIKAIKEQWAARQKKHALIKKTANNVLKVASGYGEVDFSKLQQYISEGNLIAMQAETKIVAQSISAMKKQETALSALIPDAHAWHKQFTINELQDVYAAVESKLKQWASLSLEQQAKKLSFEAIDFLGGNMNNVQSKYKTWKISQSAYFKKLEEVKDAIEWQKLDNVLKDAKAFKTKSKPYHALVSQLESAISLHDKSNAQNTAYSVALKQEALKKAAEAREIKRYAKKGNSLYADGNPFSTAELSKLKEYEKRIIENIMDGNGADDWLIEEYHDYVYDLSKKYYDKQVSIFTNEEREIMRQSTAKYLARPSKNPHYMWGADLGGIYSGKEKKVKSYLPQLKGLSKEELSIVQRFTNGSTFSNCYNLRKESSYWRNKFKKKLKGLKYSEIKEQYEMIEEWSQGANYTLDRMVRYNGITFRGLDSGGGPELRKQLMQAFQNNKPWVNNASCSTSMKHEVAVNFDGDTILIIHNKTGAYIHAISDYSSEYEIMTLRGAKYKVLTPPQKINGRYYVELEEII